jgi:hypothetical protein
VRRIIGPLIPFILASALLAACSPPKQQSVDLCKADAVLKSRGHSLDSSDVGELTEACMLNKGYALKEAGRYCSEDMATATNANCYYRDNLFGRLAARFSGD